MGRLHTPTNVLDARGSFKKHPERKRPNEPVPSAGIGPAPIGMSGQQRECWDEVVSICPPGVLGNSDRISLEILVRLLVEFRTDPAEFPGNRLMQLNTLLARFGLTPSDRAKISVPREKGANPFAGL